MLGDKLKEKRMTDEPRSEADQQAPQPGPAAVGGTESAGVSGPAAGHEGSDSSGQFPPGGSPTTPLLPYPYGIPPLTAPDPNAPPPPEAVQYPPQQPGEGSPPGRSRLGLVAAGLALALIGGGIGGGVGTLATRSADHSRSTSSNSALSVPPPRAGGQADLPANSVPAVAQKVLPSVVMIRVSGAQSVGEGSGVVLSPDGLILTNNHVASGAGRGAKIDVQFNDGSSSTATVVGIDPVSDLAVIRAQNKTNLTPIDMGTSRNLVVGQSVVAIGSPLGLAGTVTTGIVSALSRPVSTSGETGEQGAVISAVQTDAPINPGNSGGALVDMNGRLIGVNTAIATLGADTGGSGSQSGSIGLGFAIPVDQARRVADQLVKTGHATYAQIGISVRASDDADGARVLDVTPDGPAAKAGIPGGSIVTRVDDLIIDSGNALVAAVRAHQPGDQVKVTFTDANAQNPRTVPVTLAEAAPEGGR